MAYAVKWTVDKSETGNSSGRGDDRDGREWRVEHWRHRNWSTAGQAEGFVHWRESICEAYTESSPERIDDGPFAGEIRLIELGQGVSVSQLVASPHFVQRHRRDVVERPCDGVFINYQVAGTSAVRQRGAETLQRPDTVALVDGRRPFDLRFDKRFELLCLYLPMAELDAHRLDPAPAVTRAVRRDDALGKALFDSVRGILEGEDSSCPPDHLVHLASLCFGNGRSDTLADRHLKHIKRFMAEHSDDPEMQPATVAARFRISVRHLHGLFARSGTSFGQYLLHRRLCRARIALLTQPNRLILDIFLEAGFRSSSHFSRSFSREFGMTPSDMRRLGRGQ